MNGSSGILKFRENVLQFYKRNVYWILPAARFAAALALFLLLRAHLGVHGAPGAVLGGVLPNVIIALACSMLPPGFTAAAAALVMLADLYALSIEAAAVCAALILVCLLLYFRFSPRDVAVLLAMPIACALNVHYAVPVIAGLLFGPWTAVPVVFGLLFTRYVLLVEELLPRLGDRTAGGVSVGEGMIGNFRALVDGMASDRGLLILCLALAVAVVEVYLLRHLISSHVWTISISAGFVIELGILLLGDFRMRTGIDLVGVLPGIAASFLITLAVQFILLNADFSRVENVSFEDDDYFYYVRAVPKTMFLPPDTEPEEEP